APDAVGATDLRDADALGHVGLPGEGKHLARRRRGLCSGSGGLGRGGGLLGLFGARLAFLARDRALRIAALFTLHHARLVEKAQHAVGRQRALGEPGLDLVAVELEGFGLALRQQRIEIAEPLDEAAVAWRAAVRDHDVIDW